MILSPYAWLAVAALVLGLFAGVYWKGYTHGRDNVRAEWQEEKDARVVAENKATAKRIAENAAIATKNNFDKIKLKKGYENEIAKLRADGAITPILRLSAADCGFAGTSQGDRASGGNADVAGSRVLSPQTARGLFELADQADEYMASCRTLQEFVKEQGMAP